MPDSDTTICPLCQVGRRHLRLVTYSQVYNGTLVSVPNTPAWECDTCRATTIDDHAILRIEALVGQAGPPPNRHRKRPAVDTRSRTTSSRADT